MALFPKNLHAGDRIEIIMVTGEKEMVRFDKWVWIKGLPPGLRFVGEPYKEGENWVETDGWISCILIGRIRRLPLID